MIITLDLTTCEEASNQVVNWIKTNRDNISVTIKYREGRGASQIRDAYVIVHDFYEGELFKSLFHVYFKQAFTENDRQYHRQQNIKYDPLSSMNFRFVRKE